MAMIESFEKPVSFNNRENHVDEEAHPQSLSPEVSPKHPLQHSWTLWYYKNDRNKTWEENLRNVVTFSTVEDFWAVYNHIESASRLQVGCDYAVFKEGIKPMWEDERNSNGGRWLLNLDRRVRSTSLDTYWMEILLCLIGESFEEDGKIVNGAVVSLRPKGDKIGVWLGNAKLGQSIMQVGRKLKERLGLGSQKTIDFEAHEDTKHKSGSMTKKSYVV